MLPETSTYVKSYDGQFKWMYFLNEGNDLLEKLILFRIVSADIKNEFDSEPVFLKIFSHTCLAVISLDSALRKDDSYHTIVLWQVFFKECKYTEKSIISYINDNLSDCSSFSSSSDDDDGEFHEEEIRISKACLSKNIGHYFSNWKCTQKSMLYF